MLGNNLTKAREAAQGNADYFGVPYYVVSCSDGLRVEREKPVNEALISHTALPAHKEKK